MTNLLDIEQATTTWKGWLKGEYATTVLYRVFSQLDDEAIEMLSLRVRVPVARLQRVRETAVERVAQSST